jgi:hypothetical protein
VISNQKTKNWEWTGLATRRAILQSIPLMAASSVLPAGANEAEDCEFHLKALALAMKKLHGGEWRVDINHELLMAVVVRA